MSTRPPVGVLAVQGGFAAHRAALDRIGISSVEVRRAEDLDTLCGLIMPGGESSAMLTILRRRSMMSALATFGRSGRPVLATCAGLILAAHPELAWLDLTVRRNAYGSQLDSRVVHSDDGAYELVLIRAPRIDHASEDVEVLARYQGDPVLVRQGQVVGATFHPELTPCAAVHQMVFACH